ncbi:MAG: xylulokinase [Candidatus Aminicenantes bacterium]|nr:MAG: xylulokinase [Candidatus Aminicenantes bacterium]
MYAIGIDSGTQGTKVLIVDLDGNILSSGRAPHRFVDGLKPGESEQDPHVWIQALEQALGEALKEASINVQEIVSLGVSGQQHGFIPLDDEGRPIRPAKLWNDTSTAQEADTIIQSLGGKKSYIQKMGINLAVGYTASKILWLKQNEPANYQKLHTVLLPHNYINYFLTGKAHMEFGDASGTGLMDIRKCMWDQEAINAIDPELAAKLPSLSHPAEYVGYLVKEIAEQFGMRKVLVGSGGGDNMMGAIGSGNVMPGLCTLSLGTSGTISSYFAEPCIDPEGEIASMCDSTGGWLPLLCTMNVTNTTEYLKILLNISNEELDDLSQQAPGGAERLLFLPFIDGERVPVLPQANGVFFGLTRKNFNASHMARAVMEGTILNLGYGFSRMKSLGLIPSEIRATGGGAKSKLWLQIVADIFQTPVLTLREEEAAAFGAAIQSIWNYHESQGNKVKIEDLTERMVKLEDRVVEPQPETFPMYEELQDRFNSLWQTLKQEFQTHRNTSNQNNSG